MLELASLACLHKWAKPSGRPERPGKEHFQLYHRMTHFLIGPPIIVMGIGCMQLNLSYIFVGRMVIELTEPRGRYESETGGGKKQKGWDGSLSICLICLISFKTVEVWKKECHWLSVGWCMRREYHFGVVRKMSLPKSTFSLTAFGRISVVIIRMIHLIVNHFVIMQCDSSWVWNANSILLLPRFIPLEKAKQMSNQVSFILLNLNNSSSLQ